MTDLYAVFNESVSQSVSQSIHTSGHENVKCGMSNIIIKARNLSGTIVVTSEGGRCCHPAAIFIDVNALVGADTSALYTFGLNIGLLLLSWVLYLLAQQH
eukprot:scaffold107650_cov39-Prasinocladus_malaysianus.AAC.3